MKDQKGNTVLIVILVVAAAALLLGFLVMRQRIKTPQVSEHVTPDTTQNQDTLPDQSTDQTSEPAATSVVPADWKVYNNDKYVFNLQYPPSVKAGVVSGNSVLGTFQVPVKGFHVGSLVLVALKDAEIKKQADDYFKASYDLALHPQPTGDPAIPTVACTVDKINNPDASVVSVSCTGEGGPARYAYIKGSSYDVFVDGYSQGFDSQDNGKLASGDYEKILGSFKFGAGTTAATPPPANASSPTPASTPAPNPVAAPNPANPTPTPPAPNPTLPPPAIKTFSISADDNGATPAGISVPKGTIVEITFNVSATNVYYGGLDFRSSVANSGTIQAGGSKTISFTANQTFLFTPYWPASGVAKGYTITVTVQ